MKKIISILILLFIITSCESESLVTSEMNLDDELKNKLVSDKFVTSGEGYTMEVEFYLDNTFLSKDYRTYDDGTKELNFTVIGTYEIIDSILYKTGIDVKIEDSFLEYATEFYISYLPCELLISDSEIKRQTMIILDNTKGNPETIEGNWETTFWTYHRVVNSSKIEQGSVRHYYEFITDSNKVNFGWEYLEDSDAAKIDRTRNYEYNEPNLEVPFLVGRISRLVSFEQGKMIWRLKDTALKNHIEEKQGNDELDNQIILIM